MVNKPFASAQTSLLRRIVHRRLASGEAAA
jgi:hypothetical protein